jgi:hypothetical protein
MTILKQDTKVKNQYGSTLTILEIKGSAIRTIEEPNFWYSIDKLYIRGVSVRDVLKIERVANTLLLKRSA